MENDDNEKNFYASQKTFFLTFPHCLYTKRQVFDYFLVKHKPNIMIVCNEPHVDGSYHIHVWLEYSERITIRNPRYFDINELHCNIGHMENKKRNSKNNVIRYMTKYDKDPLVYGTEINFKKRGLICEYLKNGEKLEKIIDMYPEELYNYDKLRNNINLYNIDKQNVDKIIIRKGYWIYGKSGIGKSYLVRMAFDSLYEKQNNKWWDGYSCEETVLIDDFDKSCLYMSYYLKIWGDNYRFKAEIKGGVIQPTYTKIIITSNYSIYKLFSKVNKDEEPDNELINAIKRRFKEIYMYERNQSDEIIKELKS